MFRRRSKIKRSDLLEIPNIDQLKQWVLNLINKLELKEGEFTILPAYGGVLIYVINQGITWIPYSEIKVVEGKIDKGKLLESSTLFGGLAIVTVTGGSVLPFLLIPSAIKSWYRTAARPGPKKSMTFLQSMIDNVIIEKTKLNTKLLERFEDSSIDSTTSNKLVKEGNAKHDIIRYKIHIKRKYFSRNDKDNSIFRFFKYMTSVFTGIEPPIFPIHPQADISQFIKAMENNSIKITQLDLSETNLEMPDDGIII